MAGRADVKAVIVPPTASGVVLLTGAAEFVADTILELETEFDHYVREVDQDGAGITCIAVDDEEEPVELTRHRIERALVALIEQTPELAGWEVRVDVVQASLDDQAVSAEDDIEREVEGLLPSGDEISASLMREIQYERSIYDDAQLFRAVPIEVLSAEDLAMLDDEHREAALRRASALAGCLVQASVVTVDQLISDIVELREHKEHESTVTIDDTWVLGDLPPRFSDKYTALFAQKFLVALVDVTSRLTGGWQPLACIAQELGLRMVLNRVEVVAESADVALDENWRNHVEELLFEDVDHAFLYDPALDGIEDDVETERFGMPPMRFEDWFRPFNSERSLPPYALGT